MIEINHNDFNDNLGRAQEAEIITAKLLMERNPELKFRRFNDDFRWDIEMNIDGTPCNYEVKEDYRCFHNPRNNTASKGTGFIIIEFESRYKRSGIYKSMADMWVYVVHKEHENITEFFEFPPGWMKQIIKEKRYHDIYAMEGKTDSHNRVFRFEYSALVKEPEFELIHTMPLIS